MHTVARALARVYRNGRYWVLSAFSLILVFSFALWLPNYLLIYHIFGSSHTTFVGKVELLWGLWGSISTNFTVVSAAYTIFIALFSGVYASLLVFYLARKKRNVTSGVSLGVGGMISGIMGIGCAACGSYLFATLLSLIGASGAVALLPFGGVEFGIVGVILLGAAIYTISKKITDPNICSMPSE
jgi:hypothetical protein